LHLRPEPLEWLRVCAVHDARPGLRGRGIRAFGRRRYQRLDELVAKADDLVRAHVATDHAVGQARLKRLIDDAAVRREIGLAARHKAGKRHVLGKAAPTRMQDAYGTGAIGDQFDLPDTLPAIAPVLLEDTRAWRSQASREPVVEIGGRAVEVGIAAPSKMLRAVEDL